MPLINKKQPYRSMLEELEGERPFTFDGAYVLDSDGKIGQASGELGRIISRNSNEVSGLSKETQKEMERLISGITERLRKANGKFKAYVYSKGGAKTTNDVEQAEALKDKGAKVEYTVMALNGVIILEPLGQSSNATYIAKEVEGIENAITEFGRGYAINSGIIQKVIHDRSEDGRYNYKSNHILQLLDYAIEDPNNLLQVVIENNGCGLKKISQSMPKTVNKIHEKVKAKVSEMNITTEETIEVGAVTEKQQTKVEKEI